MMDLRRVKVATTRADLKRKVLLFSFCSRAFVLLLSFASNLIVPNHDAGVFKFQAPAVNKSWLDHVIKAVFGGLTRWDAQYFLHIAHYGYTNENTLAFFPLFPLIMRLFGFVLDFFLGSLINHTSAIILSTVTLNVFFFVQAATSLFELSCKVLENDKIAYIASLFFCINPASIFFTALYSESCFSFFAFKGMLFYLNNTELLSSLALGLSGCVRSNGIVNFGFIAHKTLKSIFEHIGPSKKVFPILYFVMREILNLFILAVIFLVPFSMFQIHAYSMFCLKGSDISEWCNYSIPFSYSYVQNHYWNVGFLKYYEFKQIPNFLLALPIVYLISTETYSFVVQNKSISIALGLRKVDFLRFSGKNVRPEFFVFVVHAMFLTIFGLFIINVQVTTRMIASSCPVVYWFISLRYKTESDSVQQVIPSQLDTYKKSHKYTFVETQENVYSFWKCCILTDKPANCWSYLMRIYVLLYLVIGTVLFSNFYPWT